MKLVELLARELKEWPSGTKCMAQNSDASAVMLKSLDVVYRNEIWVGADGFSIVGFRNLSELATDHATAIVTRADWQAEKARIAGKVDGGWKRHKRKSQPVSDGAIVEIRTRGGEYETCEASRFSWGATGNSQIMAYRIHNPAEQPAIEPAVVENVQAFNAQAELLYDPVAQGPLQWRDRIYELDTQRAELEATYQRQIGEIDGERGDLVERLASEGLALVEVVQLAVQWPEGAPSRESAPEWATHIGRDTLGFHWFDHSPEEFDRECFLKGCLGDAGYRNGRWEKALKAPNSLPLWSCEI